MYVIFDRETFYLCVILHIRYAINGSVHITFFFLLFIGVSALSKYSIIKSGETRIFKLLFLQRGFLIFQGSN